MSALDVTVENRSGTELDLAWAEELAMVVLGRLGHRRGELGLTFVDDEEMAALNQEHMKKEGVTDVLSFPLDAGESEGEAEMPLLLGDVVICPREAAARAPESSAAAAVCLLIIHGILHISGYDHDHDQGEMEAFESELAGELCHD